MMGPIYTSISWILLRWHDLWAALLPGSGVVLGTNWEWVLAIGFLVITVRVILFPIFVKQIRSQRAMQVLQPKVKALQEKHKGDSQTLREEMMKLYQAEKVNPLMGCLPMFLQIPVFLGLFHVLKHLNPLANGGKTLYGWSVGEFDSASHAKLFGAPISMAFRSSSETVTAVGGTALTVQIVAAILVIIMMITTFMTSRQMILKTGWSEDPQQRMIQKLMLYGIPVSLLLSGWAFPIGVIIYWVTQNIFSLGQQYWVLHKYPPPVAAGAKSVPVSGLFLRSSSATSSTKPGSARSGGPAGRTAASANGVAKPTSGARRMVSQIGEKSGLFSRKRETEPPPVVKAAETSARTPKPGAKPVKSKKGGSKR